MNAKMKQQVKTTVKSLIQKGMIEEAGKVVRSMSSGTYSLKLRFNDIDWNLDNVLSENGITGYIDGKGHKIISLLDIKKTYATGTTGNNF